jgi:hypothetical protein
VREKEKSRIHGGKNILRSLTTDDEATSKETLSISKEVFGPMT